MLSYLNVFLRKIHALLHQDLLRFGISWAPNLKDKPCCVEIIPDSFKGTIWLCLVQQVDVPCCKVNRCRPGICAGYAEAYYHAAFASAHSDSGKVTAYQGGKIWLQPVSSQKTPNTT